MKVQSMKANHKVRKFKSDKVKNQKLSYKRKLAVSHDVTSKEEFEASMEYMNEWLNHPLFPEFI